MFAINLLKRSLADTRRLRRRRIVECLAGLVALSLVCVGFGLMWMDVNHRIHGLRADLAAKQEQVAFRARVESDVKALVDEKEDLMQGVLRLEDIQRLRIQSVSILDTVSRSLDPLDLWLVSMQLDKGGLALEGLAGSREEVFRFWNNLEHHPLFREVTISGTREELIAENALYSFSMNLKVNAEYVGSTPS